MDFASYLEEIPDKTCECGYTGKTYMFVSINGIEKCVRCAGCEEIKPTKGMLLAAAQGRRASAARGRNKSRKAIDVHYDEEPD